MSFGAPETLRVLGGPEPPLSQLVDSVRRPEDARLDRFRASGRLEPQPDVGEADFYARLYHAGPQRPGTDVQSA